VINNFLLTKEEQAHSLLNEYKLDYDLD